MDCITMSIFIGKEMGKELPEGWSYRGYDLSTHGEIFNKSKEEQAEYMIGFYETFFEEIDAGKAFIGDICLMQSKKLMITAGIVLGNGNLMIIFTDAGVRIYSIDKFKMEQKRFFRWR